MFLVVSLLLLLLLLCAGSQNLQYWERMQEWDLITDCQDRHMQANIPKTRLTRREQRSKMCLQFVFFSLPVLQHKILGFNAVTFFSAMREELIPVCLNSNPSPVAQLQRQMLWLKGGLAVVGQKLAKTGRFSCFHPTSRHDCCGFRALTLLSRKRSQRVLQGTPCGWPQEVDDKKLLSNSCSIVDY